MSFNILRRSNTQKGFTLLEMLLVIAIIAILAAIVIVAINPVRQLAQARNAQRASDLNAIHKAIQQYYVDNQKWPRDEDSDLDLGIEPQNICGSGDDTDCIDLEEALVPNYISSIPTNPAGGGYQIAINSRNRLELIAEGSNEQELTPVVIGTSTAAVVDDDGDDPVNGACGSANGQSFESAPSTNLCSAGTASSVTGSGPWTWTCVGSNGGSTASCSADSEGGEIFVCEASGGEESTVGGYKYHVYEEVGSDTFNVISEECIVEVLVVAGGGGGSGRGAGGGAGGLNYDEDLIVSSGVISVTVGNGGSGGSSDSGGNNGTNSVFGNIISIGGGAGGTLASGPGNNGSGGGSGGGGGGLMSGGLGTGGSSLGQNQGYAGGNGWHQSGQYAAYGGGGGAGGRGADRNFTSGGAGGVGREFQQFAAVAGNPAGWFAGGGGGIGEQSSNRYPATGGDGGGGDGGIPGANGDPGTGGGGGGTASNSTGGRGGSGIVIVRYEI
jgi:prepilin-type N-terminal cleavage/methylation domain-containing protein